MSLAQTQALLDAQTQTNPWARARVSLK